MATNNELDIIYKKIAEYINEVAISKGITRLYDVFCNQLQITRYINMYNIQCSDISSIKINILKAYKENDTAKINQELTLLYNSVLNCKDNDKDNTELVQVLELLSFIYGENIHEDIATKSLNEILEYNAKINIDTYNKNILKKKLCSESVNIECKHFKDVEIKDKSIVLIYAPFRKTNILEDRFNHKQLDEWISELYNRENITMFVISREDMGDNFRIVEEFQKNKKRNRLKLYINKEVWDELFGDDNLDDF